MVARRGQVVGVAPDGPAPVGSGTVLPVAPSSVAEPLPGELLGVPVSVPPSSGGELRSGELLGVAVSVLSSVGAGSSEGRGVSLLSVGAVGSDEGAADGPGAPVVASPDGEYG